MHCAVGLLPPSQMLNVTPAPHLLSGAGTNLQVWRLLTTTAGMRSPGWVNTTAPSKTTIGRFNTIHPMPRLSITAGWPIKNAAITTVRWPTLINRSSLILDHASAFANRAETYRDLHELGPAEEDYSQAIRLQPDLDGIWNARCWLRAIKGDLSEALSDCNEALRLNPNAAATLDLKGLVHLKLRDWGAAVADYNSALRLDSKLASSLYGRGLARLRSGNAAGGNSDIAAAKSIKADIAEEFERYGVR